MSIQERLSGPWHREPWPWLLAAGPALVIVAGVITSVIAWRTSDGLVADDYAKQGLVINRSLARDARAEDLGLAATVSFSPQRDALRLALSAYSPQSSSQSSPLQLILVHPTRAGLDRSVTLDRLDKLDKLAPGLYEARIAPPAPGAWLLRVESAEAGWRLAGRWHTGQATIVLGAKPARPAP